MKDWLYHVGSNSLTLPLRVFLSKIHFDGLENFPKNKPVLLAGNHPNSFFDGVIFEHIFRRKIYTIVRGDVFKNPIANYCLRGVRLLPIFRARDARADVARSGNQQTTDECATILRRNHCLLIFPEGIAYPEKAIRPIKRGTSKLAISMLKEGVDLYVVPFGLNYEDFDTYQTRAHICLDKPIRMMDYENRIENEEKEVAQEINDVFATTFNSKIVINKERDEALDFAQTMALNEKENPYSTVNKESGVYKAIENINNASDSLKKEVLDYKNLLKSMKVDDNNLRTKYADFISIFIAFFTGVVSFPAFVLSTVFTYLAKLFVNKKIKNPVFTDSIYVGVNMVLHWIWLTVVIVVALKLGDSYWPLVFIVGMLYGTYAWYRFVAQVPVLWKELRYLSLSSKKKEDLQAKRNSILSQLFAD